jgi:hypothetical protein
VLKTRRYRGEATLILEGNGGTFSVLEDWTDRAAPTSLGARRQFSAAALLELVQLAQQLKAGKTSLIQTKGVDRCAPMPQYQSS